MVSPLIFLFEVDLSIITIIIIVNSAVNDRYFIIYLFHYFYFHYYYLQTSVRLRYKYKENGLEFFRPRSTNSPKNFGTIFAVISNLFLTQQEIYPKFYSIEMKSNSGVDSHPLTLRQVCNNLKYFHILFHQQNRKSSRYFEIIKTKK